MDFEKFVRIWFCINFFEKLLITLLNLAEFEEELQKVLIRLICMPVILVVGLVIYIKKSEAKRRKKIVVLMITILIYIFIWLWLPIILDFFVEQH